MSGSDVTRLQEFLAQEYSNFPAATGFFGPTTQAAVKQWQREHGIEQVGVVGPRTRAAMACKNSPITNSGAKAKLLQSLLAQLKVLQDKLAALTGTQTANVPPGGGGGGAPAFTVPSPALSPTPSSVLPPTLTPTPTHPPTPVPATTPARDPIPLRVPDAGTTIACTGIDDRDEIQTALDAGGTVTLQGTCAHSSAIVLRQPAGIGNERGATILEGGALIGPGVVIDGDRRVTMRNMEIRSTGVGIAVRNAIFVSLHNLTVASEKDGIDLQSVAGTWVTGSTRIVGTPGNSSYGIRVGGSPEGYEALWADGVRIEGHDGGVRIGGPGGNNLNMSLTDLRISQASDAGILLDPSGSALRNIQINNCAMSDIGVPIVAKGSVKRVIVNGCAIAHSKEQIASNAGLTLDNVIYVESLPPYAPTPALEDAEAVGVSPTASIACAAGDYTAPIQSALNRGGKVTLKGICSHAAPLRITSGGNGTPRTVIEGGVLYGPGLVIEGARDPVVRDVEIKSSGVGITVRNTKNVLLHSTYVHSNGDGLALDSVEGTTLTGAMHFDGVVGNDTYGVRIAISGPVSNVRMRGTNFETHDSGIRVGGADASNIALTDIKVDRARLFPFIVNPSGSAGARNIRINNCFIHDSNYSLTLNSAETSGIVDDIRVNRCIFAGTNNSLVEWGPAHFISSGITTGPSNTFGGD